VEIPFPDDQPPDWPDQYYSLTETIPARGVIQIQYGAYRAYANPESVISAGTSYTPASLAAALDASDWEVREGQPEVAELAFTQDDISTEMFKESTSVQFPNGNPVTRTLIGLSKMAITALATAISPYVAISVGTTLQGQGILAPIGNFLATNADKIDLGIIGGIVADRIGGEDYGQHTFSSPVVREGLGYFHVQTGQAVTRSDYSGQKPAYSETAPKRLAAKNAAFDLPKRRRFYPVIGVGAPDIPPTSPSVYESDWGHVVERIQGLFQHSVKLRPHISRRTYVMPWSESRMKQMLTDPSGELSGGPAYDITFEMESFGFETVGTQPVDNRRVVQMRDGSKLTGVNAVFLHGRLVAFQKSDGSWIKWQIEDFDFS
jgi:hypothetical protein